jgi:hypothetical protein
MIDTVELFSSQALAFIIIILAILLYTTSSLVDFRLIQKTRMFNPKPVFQVGYVNLLYDCFFIFLNFPESKIYIFF